MKELRAEVYGRVQGVGFRDSLKKFADGVALKGFVMNKDDGGVSILAQGDEKHLRELIFEIEKGPGFSKIESMSYNFCDMGKEYPDFSVVRQSNIIFDKAKSLLNLGKSVAGIGRKIPKHVAIIPDGNRRWAKSKGFDGVFGHYKSGAYDSLEKLFKEGNKLGVQFMTIWGFSSENWKRSAVEQAAIFELILSGVERFLRDANKNKMRFRHIGRKDRLPKKLSDALVALEEATKDYDKFNVQLCLDYGGRDEIVRAVNGILKAKKDSVDENEFLSFLDSQDVPDPDLIIRTGGERRLSGFMPFQSVYAELYFSDRYFPDFDANELKRAILNFGRRQRRFGGD